MKTKTSVQFIPTAIHPRPSALFLCFALIVGTATATGAGQAGSPPPMERKGAQSLLETAPHSQAANSLPSEHEIPALCEFADGWAALPKRTQFVTTTRDGKTARLAVQEVGKGREVIVCVHGLFSDGSNWRYVAAAMAGDHQLWLVDLPGCGASDRLKSTKGDLATYSPEALADRVWQVIEDRLAAHPEVNRVLIAGHSLGGMIVLRMFSSDDLRLRHAAVLARVQGLVLFAPADVLVTQATEDWLTFLALNSCKVEIGNALGILPAAMTKSVRASFCDPSLASRELISQGCRLLDDANHRVANQSMMRSALPWREFGKVPDFDVSESLEAGYRQVQVPCLIVWGQRDVTLSAAMGYKLKDQLPNAHLVVVSQSKHLLMMERPAVCAQLIRDFDQQLAEDRVPTAHSVQSLGSRLAANLASLPQ